MTRSRWQRDTGWSPTRMLTRLATRGAAALTVTALAGCTSFSTVRSADVRPGTAVTLQASVASRLSDDAAWFWTFECAPQCDRTVQAFDVVFEHGRRPPQGPAYTLGLGVAGVFPYAEAYVQLGAARRRPFGVGGRLGLPVWSWTEHQIYGRLDIPLASRRRLLLNPGIFYHTGTSPNGANPGSFIGLVQGVGLEFDMGHASIRPSAAVVWGRAERRRSGERFGPTTGVFGTASLAVSVHRPRQGPRVLRN